MRQLQLQIALGKKTKKRIHKRKENRKNIEKLMAKFENYANQSATMGVT